MTLCDQCACKGISREVLSICASLNSAYYILCHNTSRAKPQPALKSALGSPSLGHRTIHTERFQVGKQGLHHEFLSSKVKARAGTGVFIDLI